jgi:hypothetical protein
MSKDAETIQRLFLDSNTEPSRVPSIVATIVFWSVVGLSAYFIL